MIISLKKNTPEVEVQSFIQVLENLGVEVNRIQGADYDVFGLVGDTTRVDEKMIRANPYVDEVTRIAAPYKKANRLFHPQDTVVDVAGIKVGGQEKIVMIGGPCSIEGEEPTLEIASMVKEAGGCMLRGGAYKPRTSPYAFQGLGVDGLKYMAQAREKYGLPVVSEMMSVDKLPEFEEYCDLIQVGARNMQNFDLLKVLGKTK